MDGNYNEVLKMFDLTYKQKKSKHASLYARKENMTSTKIEI